MSMYTFFKYPSVLRAEHLCPISIELKYGTILILGKYIFYINVF